MIEKPRFRRKVEKLAADVHQESGRARLWKMQALGQTIQNGLTKRTGIELLILKTQVARKSGRAFQRQADEGGEVEQLLSVKAIRCRLTKPKKAS